MKFILFTFIGLITILFGCLPKKKYSYEVLKEISTDMNRRCPIQLDSETRLDSVRAYSNGILRFNQTVWIDTFTYDIREFKKSLAQMAIDQIKASPDKKLFQENSTVLEYFYSDTLGHRLFTFAITPDIYGSDLKKR